MEEHHRGTALRARDAIERQLHDPAAFRAALLRVPANDRDGWLNLALGLSELPDDGPGLPPGCVPYLPCAVDVLLRMVDQAGVQASDVFVDLGSGLGRATTFVNLLTGASAIGVEIQPSLALAARNLSERLHLSRVRCIEGDAVRLVGPAAMGSVYFLYCPFGGEHLEKALHQLQKVATTRPVRVCCVDLPLPPRAWLTPDPASAGDLVVYRSTLHEPLPGEALRAKE